MSSEDQELGTISSSPLAFGGFRVQHSTHYLMDKFTAQLANINAGSSNGKHTPPPSEDKNIQIKKESEPAEPAPLNKSQEIAKNNENTDEKEEETKKKVITRQIQKLIIAIFSSNKTRFIRSIIVTIYLIYIFNIILGSRTQTEPR